MENIDTAAQTAHPPEIMNKPGCYALIAHTETGDVKELYSKSKKELAKQLEVYGTKYMLLGAFRGKKLNPTKKVSFKFS
jgi:hypothetical protein